MHEQTTNLDQPLEKPVKKILLSASCDGRLMWALVPAMKVGRHYRVDRATIESLIDAVRLGDSSKRVWLQ